MDFLKYSIIPSDKVVKEFKKQIKKHYGKEYTNKEARKGAYNLLNFFRVLAKVDKRIKLKTQTKDENR